MHTTAEKTTSHTPTVQRQSGAPFFARKHDGLQPSTEKSFFSSSFIQPKLSVSQPDDPQEKEADQMATKVMTMPEPAVVSPAADKNEELQRAPEEKELQKMEEQKKEEVQRVVQRKEEKEEVQAKEEEEVHRKEEDKEEVQRAEEKKEDEQVQRMCSDCKEEKKEVQRQEQKEEVQTKSFDSASSDNHRSFSLSLKGEGEEEKEKISRKPSSACRPPIIMRSGRGPPSHQNTFEQTLESSKGIGSPMPRETVGFMESRFNADFSGVRIHTSETSVQMNRDIHAQAFTHGNDIYFNNGKYSPNTSDGQFLLAHELTHTIQQGASNHVSTPGKSGSGSTVSTKRISRKRLIQRSAANLAAAVSLAKGEQGKVIANKEGGDGFRVGWPRLLEYFKTTFGAEKIIPDGQSVDVGTVAESSIKKKGEAHNVDIIDNDGKKQTGSRDIMPSWCGIFAFWSLNKAGLPMKKWELGKMTIPPEAASPTPQPGFLAYRNLRSHYGLVEKADGSQVTTINGNTAGEDNLGGEIQVQTHAISNWTAFIDPLKLIEGTIRNPENGVQEKPKTLDELRKELFNVQTKPEDRTKDEKQVQTKTDKATKSIHAPSIPVQTKPEAEQKEELKRKEESKEEESNTLQRKEFVRSDAAVSDTRNNSEPAIEVSRKSAPKIQRGIFSAIGGAISSAVEWVGDKLEEGKKWLLKKVSALIQNVPGYKALCVALKKDPITGETVERNGKNFIAAAIGLMPGGKQLHEKMTELGILEKAELFVDKIIGRVDDLISGISSVFSNFYNSLSLSDLKDIPGVFTRLESAFTSFFNHIIDFAKGVGKDFLEFIKTALLIPLGTYIKTKTKFWDLLCLVIGKDPLTDEVKKPTGANILTAILNISDEGVEQKKKMQETGTFNKVAAWIDKGIAVFGKAYDMLVAAFKGLWNIVSIDTLMHPIDTFLKIFNSFWQPISLVGKFFIEAGIAILKIVKDVLFQWISDKGKETKGYYLVTVLISKDPFTGERVPRTTENLIKGFMLLSEGGEEQFNKMKESGAIDRATAKIDAAVATLGFTWAYVKGLFSKLWESFTWKDLLVPLMAFVKIINTFKNPILRLITFIITVVVALFEVILRMMGFPVDLVFKLIDNVKKAWASIKANPTGFLLNLLKAIKQGFTQFFDNILTHLWEGLKAWLKQELADAGVPMPVDYSVMGIIKWLLVILDITMEKIWKKLETRIGKEKVDKVRSLIAKAEAIYDKANEAMAFIEDVRTRGMDAIVDKIKEKLNNIWDMVLDAIKSFIMDQIIKKVTVKLLSMLDPTGIMAVINSAIALYKAIQSFFKYLARILEIINSFVEGIIEICSGNIVSAANFLERSLANGIPVVIGFLANQVGLDLSGRIKEVLSTVREKVDKGLDFLIDKLVGFVENIVAKVKAGIAAVSSWWKARGTFRDSENHEHLVYFEGEGESATLTVKSEPQPYTKFLSIYEDQLDAATKAEKAADLKKAKDKAKEIEDEKKKSVGGKDDEEKKKNQEAKDAKIGSLVLELAALSQPLFGKEKPKDWNKLPAPGDGGFAAAMKAERLFKTDKLLGEGSEPTSAKHAVYDDVDIRQKGKGSYYIRGHLLNHNLGGPGQWENMTALSRTGNHQHESQVESLVKAAFDAGAVVSYNIEAKGKVSAKIPSESDKPSFKMIPDINKHFNSIKKIIAAESNIPKQLECEAYTMKKESSNWVNDKKIVKTTVENNVETDYSKYEVGDSVPLPKVNLTTKENKSSLTDVIDYDPASRSEFITKIWKIMDAKIIKDGASFGSYDGLASYKRMSADGKKVLTEFSSSEQQYIKKMKENPNVIL